jgi:hypothetical protein
VFGIVSIVTADLLPQSRQSCSCLHLSSKWNDGFTLCALIAAFNEEPTLLAW